MPCSTLRKTRLCQAFTALSITIVFMGCAGSKEKAPTIQRFEITPSTVDVGDAVKFRIDFDKGTGVLEPALGEVKSGQELTISAIQNTTYCLTVHSPDGSAQAEQKLTVRPGLWVQVSGLPEGVPPQIQVQGPDGFQQALTKTTVMKDLKPGKYTISAPTVKEGEISRYPLMLSQEVDIKDTGAQVKVHYPAPTQSFKLNDTQKLEFVLIPPGKFLMGLGPGQEAGWGETSIAYAQPQTEITIPKAFYMARYPVTYRQWEAVMHDAPIGYGNPEMAVGVTWLDAKQKFLPALSKLIQQPHLRLPSESEWEYALRAGTQTRYFWGDELGDYKQFCWTHEETIAIKHMPSVGGKKANAWGLYDMFSTGNWTEDDDHYNLNNIPLNGSHYKQNSARYHRIWRGGHFSQQDSFSVVFSSAARSGGGSNIFEAATGVRPVMEIYN